MCIRDSLTTMAPSGQPENTVVWCSWDGEYVLVNTADGRRKPDNVRKNPKVALTVIDPQNAFRWIDVDVYKRQSLAWRRRASFS